MKKNKKVIDAILESLKNGVNLVNACKAVDIDYVTLYLWQKKDKDLADKINAIRDSRVLVIEEVFYKKLLEGKGAPLEYIYYFNNRAPARWKNLNELKHTGNVGVKHKTEKLNENELKAIIEGCGYVKKTNGKNGNKSGK